MQAAKRTAGPRNERASQVSFRSASRSSSSTPNSLPPGARTVLEKIPPPVADLLAPMYVWVLGLLGAAVGYLEDFKYDDGWKVWIFKALTKVSSSALAA